MKNTIKMSLVAALAVAGFSTAASAGSLEEAIKGVSISGKMEVEYDYSKSSTDVTGTNDTTRDKWDLDWDATVKVPVNDNITAVFGVEGDVETDVSDDGSIVTGSSTTAFLGDSDEESTVNITKTYFQYANGPVTAMVGKQGIGAPWFDDERANGVKALYTVGPVTLAAAHFTNSNAAGLGNTNISAVAAIGSVGPVNFQAWYADLAGVAVDTTVTPNNELNADSWILMADATFDIVNVGAKYGTADYDRTTSAAAYNQLDDDAEMIQLMVSADFGVATPYAGMGMTDSKQGGFGLDLTGDTDSVIDFGSEQLSIDDLDDATAYVIGVTVPVGDLTIDASYVWGEYDDYATLDTTKTTAYGSDLEEFLIQVDYKMSKNFTIGAHYSTAELESQAVAGTKVTTDSDDAAISLEYKF
jgi:hypothetical protein